MPDPRKGAVTFTRVFSRSCPTSEVSTTPVDYNNGIIARGRVLSITVDKNLQHFYKDSMPDGDTSEDEGFSSRSSNDGHAKERDKILSVRPDGKKGFPSSLTPTQYPRSKRNFHAHSYFSKCNLQNVARITVCTHPKGVHTVGMMMYYRDGHRECVGEYRPTGSPSMGNSTLLRP
jgi:hypothetical protein